MQIKRTVLANAVKYNGKASVGSVVGALMQEDPKLKSKIKELMKDISKEVARVNKLSLEKQKKELESLGGAKKIEKKKRGMFDFLGIKEGERIITSFPPGPEKYPHIGHAKAALMNYLLAKEYKGKFVPRFEDTNPETVGKKFYDVMLENFAWLGIKWKDWHCASDYMEEYYKAAEKLVKKGEMYICTCSQAVTSANRKKGVECRCRNEGDQLKKWKDFFKAKAGSSVVRLRINMKHRNSTMRDPAMFRINDTKHARQGKKYRVWPTYDFQNAYMDGKLKVTHRLRTKEFEMRAELQRYLQKLLGLNITTTYEFGRFNMEGVLSSGRVIRKQIEEDKLVGWDDPRLTTIVALRRRGFLPEAIKDFVLSTGISKTDSTVTWDDLIVKNKRLLDSSAKRYSFVEKPKKIKIKGCDLKQVEVRIHPEKDYGVRKFKLGEEFYVSDKIEKGINYRFMHLFNFKDKKFISLDHDPKLKAKLIHWVPVGSEVEVEVLMDNGKWIKGFAEKNIQSVKVGEVIQFERFGFCRKDSAKKFIFTHR